MCGFIVHIKANTRGDHLKFIEKGLAAMVNRGPDAEGIWVGDDCILAHRRLAIQDLDARSHQPMLSRCGNFLIVFNGEIYNFLELREELINDKGNLSTLSDTEVILALFIKYGEEMLPRLRGMFSFVIWDIKKKFAFFARDPYGIKPLYVAETKNGLLFASQVKALIATNLVNESTDFDGVYSFWLLGSIAEPNTSYKNIHAIKPGVCGWVKDGEILNKKLWLDIGSYWNAPQAMSASDQYVKDTVKKAVFSSVKSHIVSDVPVAVFLSGGIDSSVLAGLMVEAGLTNLHGITITYNEFAGSIQDEAPVAARIAEHFGIKHHIRVVTKDEFFQDLPAIFDSMDQPSIDGINTWYASKAVKELGLKVVISGVGGDELFQGYKHFRQLPIIVRVWEHASKLPFAKKIASILFDWKAKTSNNRRWKHFPDWVCNISSAWWMKRSLNSFAEARLKLPSSYKNENEDPVDWVANMCGALPKDRYMALSQIESMTYLRNQLLRDSDWASMYHSIELRAPLVDSFLLKELSPYLHAFSRFPNKVLLSNCLSKKLPDDILKREKTGFGIPVVSWLEEYVSQKNEHNSQCVASFVMGRHVFSS